MHYLFVPVIVFRSVTAPSKKKHPFQCRADHKGSREGSCGSKSRYMRHMGMARGTRAVGMVGEGLIVVPGGVELSEMAMRAGCPDGGDESK